MKLTSSKLRKMIKEELQHLLTENYLKRTIVEPSADKELQQIMDPVDYKNLAKRFEYWDDKLDTRSDIDDSEFYELDGFFPIDTARDFFKYAKAYAEKLDRNQMRQGAKDILNIVNKY